MNLKFLQIGLLGGVILLLGCASFESKLKSVKLPLQTTADQNQQIDGMYSIARIAERNGRTESAIQAHQEILTMNPSYAPSLHRLGVISCKLANFDRAMKYFDEAVAVGGPSAELLGDIGFALYLQEDLEGATETLRRAAVEDPTDKRILNNLAVVMGAQKKYNESVDLFRQTGTEAESLAGLAFVQSQTNQLEDAKRNYHRALELDSSLTIAANGLIELSNSPATDVRSASITKPKLDGLPAGSPNRVAVVSANPIVEKLPSPATEKVVTVSYEEAYTPNPAPVMARISDQRSVAQPVTPQRSIPQPSSVQDVGRNMPTAPALHSPVPSMSAQAKSQPFVPAPAPVVSQAPIAVTENGSFGSIPPTMQVNVKSQFRSKPQPLVEPVPKVVTIQRQPKRAVVAGPKYQPHVLSPAPVDFKTPATVVEKGAFEFKVPAMQNGVGSRALPKPQSAAKPVPKVAATPRKPNRAILNELMNQPRVQSPVPVVSRTPIAVVEDGSFGFKVPTMQNSVGSRKLPPQNPVVFTEPTKQQVKEKPPVDAVPKPKNDQSLLKRMLR